MNLEQKKIGCLALGNAATLVACIVKEINGSYIGNSLNGSRLSKTTIETLAHQRMANKLLNG